MRQNAPGSSGALVGGMSRSMSSREMIAGAAQAGRQVATSVAKSVVVAKVAQSAAQRLGVFAAASSAGTLASGLGLLMARKLHPEYLDPVSANQINQDPEYCMNVHCLVLFKEPLDMEEVNKTFEFYVQNFGRFRSRPVVRQWMWPYWEPVVKVEMRQHIFGDSQPMDQASMQQYVSASLIEGLNPLIPLWRATVFPNYTQEDGTPGCAMLLKYHHCMGDGFSFVQTLMTNVQLLEAPEEKPPSIAAAVAQKVHQPGALGKVAGKFAAASAKLITVQDDPASVIKAQKLLKPSDRRIAVWVKAAMTLDQIKRSAKTQGLTVNDMLIGALSAVLRNFTVMKGGKLQDPLSVVWVALRPLSEAYAATAGGAEKAQELGDPGNQTLGAVYLRLPVQQDGPRSERAVEVARRIGEMKNSPEPLLAQKLTGLFGLLPKSLSNPIWDALSNKVSISVSNVPGPQADNMTWCGGKLVSTQFWVPPVGTISTFVTMMTFNNRVSLSLALDGALFSDDDAAFICKEFTTELDLLCSSMAPSRL